MEYLAIVGDPGSGKTNILTKYCHDEYERNVPIIANYHLSFPSTYMTFGELLNAGREIDGSFIALDELGLGLDSYEFLAKGTKGLTQFVAQIRKFHCRCAFTVQRFSMIARRLRLLTDGFIVMEDKDKYNMRDADGNLVSDHRKVCKGLFRAEYLDRDLRQVRTPRTFNGRRYWGMYNTDEIITRLNHSGSSESDVDELDLEYAG